MDVLRVVQWATGSVGKAAIAAIEAHPELELVGCWVHSPDKHGRDVGEIIGSQPLGVRATSDMAEILALQADAVVYAPLLPDAGEVEALLRAGFDVVTPVGWFYPNEEQAAPLHAAAVAGNATLHGTGIGPGGATELLPLIFSALSSSVTFVRGEEYSDLRTYDAPNVVLWIMQFGGTPEEARSGPMPKILGAGFAQSVHMCLDALGLHGRGDVRSRHEVAVATAPIDSPIGVIEPGAVAAQRFHWEGVVDGQVVVRVTVNWLMGEENLDPPWEFGPAGERYEVEVQGSPSAFVTVKGWQPESVEAGLISNPGITATAAHCVNSIPYVCAAEPGIATFVDLPLVAGRSTLSTSREPVV